MKSWTLRGTVHVFCESDLPLFVRDSYRSRDWSAESFWNKWDSWALTPERQQYFSDAVVECLGSGPKTRDELKAVCRSAGMTAEEETCMFHPWGGGIRQLCERGFMAYTAEEQKRFVALPEYVPMEADAAERELARRYFTFYGPATVRDAAYFFRLPVSRVKQWLGVLPVSCAAVEGREYFYVENGACPEEKIPECLFLAGFDQIMMGYEKKESLHVSPENIRGIFNLAGIVMPPLMLDGVVAGRWKRKNRKLEISLFRGISPGERRAICRKARELWGESVNISFAE